MSAVMKTSVAGELVEAEEFFAPTPYGLIDVAIYAGSKAA